MVSLKRDTDQLERDHGHAIQTGEPGEERTEFSLHMMSIVRFCSQ